MVLIILAVVVRQWLNGYGGEGDDYDKGGYK